MRVRTDWIPRGTIFVCLSRTTSRIRGLSYAAWKGPINYPDLDKMTSEPEFADVIDRLVITAEPGYLAKFTSTSQVVSYQRRFMNAVQSK